MQKISIQTKKLINAHVKICKIQISTKADYLSIAEQQCQISGDIKNKQIFDEEMEAVNRKHNNMHALACMQNTIVIYTLVTM